MIRELDKPDRTPRRRKQLLRTAAPAMPAGIVFTEHAVALLRAYLLENSLQNYAVYHVRSLDLEDLESMLNVIDPSAAWKALPALIPRGQSITPLTHDSERAWTWPAGVLRLQKYEVVLARWYWVDVQDRCQLARVTLCAACSPKHYLRLRDDVRKQRRLRMANRWQIVSGYENRDAPTLPRDAGQVEDLIVPDDLRRRIAIEIVRFFSDEVATLFRELNVPYRRGVLLHGPPGNGKTSLIRLIGRELSQIPILILRKLGCFDDDDFHEVIRRWKMQAPAILVIEDLNWLLKEVNLSTFLNLMDGIDSKLSGGLLMIATTNHPDQLDPAINNRPGRFDVVIEVMNPTRSIREAFLRKKLPAMAQETLTRAAERSSGFSFAHLHEVLRLSGLLAIEGGRSARSDQDLLRAIDLLRESNEDAQQGFRTKPDEPFGLAQWKSKR